MSTLFSAMQHLKGMVLQIAVVLNGMQVLQPVKLPVIKGMVPYNKQ